MMLDTRFSPIPSEGLDSVLVVAVAAGFGKGRRADDR